MSYLSRLGVDPALGKQVFSNNLERVTISVVVPCYRSTATIVRTIESILDQSFPPTEVILVEDASGDETLDLLRRSTQGDARIRVIERKVNGGVATARNLGWDEATGKYVAFLDSDATWHRQKLEIHAAFMERHDDIALSGTAHHVLADVKPLELIRDSPEFRRISFADLLWRNRFVTSSAMVRRGLPFRFRNGQRHMEDHRLWLEIANAGYHIALLDAPLAYHHKPDFGAAGLSAELAAMGKAELGNYLALRETNAIGTLKYLTLVVWSRVKFLRRFVVVAIRRATRI